MPEVRRCAAPALRHHPNRIPTAPVFGVWPGLRPFCALNPPLEAVRRRTGEAQKGPASKNLAAYAAWVSRCCATTAPRLPRFCAP